MRLKAAFLSGFLLLAGVAPAAWEDHIKSAVLAQRKGALKQAEEELARALLLAERFGEKDPRLAYTQDYMGLLYLNRQEPQDAKLLFEKALAGFEAARGPGSEEALMEAGRLAEACSQLKEWRRAEELYRRVLEAKLKDPKTTAGVSAEAHTDLGIALDAQGKITAAIAEYEQAQELRRSLASQSTELAESLSNLGRAYYVKGDYAQAEQLMLQALEMDEAVAGPDHALVADDLRRLAPVLRKAGKESEAVAALARAKQISAPAEKPKGKKKRASR